MNGMSINPKVFIYVEQKSGFNGGFRATWAVRDTDDHTVIPLDFVKREADSVYDATAALCRGCDVCRNDFKLVLAGAEEMFHRLLSILKKSGFTITEVGVDSIKAMEIVRFFNDVDGSGKSEEIFAVYGEYRMQEKDVVKFTVLDASDRKSFEFSISANSDESESFDDAILEQINEWRNLNAKEVSAPSEKENFDFI